MTKWYRKTTKWAIRARTWLSSERGASTAEYALLLALVVVFLITALSELGQTLAGRIQGIVQDINSAQTSPLN
ncbi:MAG: Flp family type IVb pilin [Clostridia bacterium]|nr:Flp family type IVb pilin [Clostridia bacterium]